MTWYYVLILVAVLVVMYVLMITRQKNQEKRSQEVMNSFQVGDKVVTHIGIYGRIKKIYNTTYGKVCVLEIGTNNKLDIEIDMRYLAGKDEKTLVVDEPAPVVKEKAEINKAELNEEKPEKQESVDSEKSNTKKTKKQKKQN